MHEAENVVQRCLVIRLGFEPNKFSIDRFKAFGCFREKFAEKIVHRDKARFKYLASGFLGRRLFGLQKSV